MLCLLRRSFWHRGLNRRFRTGSKFVKTSFAATHVVLTSAMMENLMLLASENKILHKSCIIREWKPWNVLALLCRQCHSFPLCGRSCAYHIFSRARRLISVALLVFQCICCNAPVISRYNWRHFMTEKKRSVRFPPNVGRVPGKMDAFVSSEITDPFRARTGGGGGQRCDTHMQIQKSDAMTSDTP